MDKVSRVVRSQIMAKVRSVDNQSTERRLRASLAGSGISGYKLQAKGMPGSPDFIFPDKRVAIFVDGCFWHGCPQCYRRPNSSQEYWDKKVKRNKERDRINRAELREMGWLPIRIWEHELASLPHVRALILSAFKRQKAKIIV